jgi:hypothetical protein
LFKTRIEMPKSFALVAEYSVLKAARSPNAIRAIMASISAGVVMCWRLPLFRLSQDGAWL